MTEERATYSMLASRALDLLQRARNSEGDERFGLAGQLNALGLIDEYRAMVHPVLVGGGIPYFPHRERRVDLELVETRTFSSGVVYVRYRVAR